MNLTHCPLCNARILSTHRCNARPADLVPMPAGFKDLVEQARTNVDAPSLEQITLLPVSGSGHCVVCGAGEFGDCVCPR